MFLLVKRSQYFDSSIESSVCYLLLLGIRAPYPLCQYSCSVPLNRFGPSTLSRRVHRTKRLRELQRTSRSTPRATKKAALTHDSRGTFSMDELHSDAGFSRGGLSFDTDLRQNLHGQYQARIAGHDIRNNRQHGAGPIPCSSLRDSNTGAGSRLCLGYVQPAPKTAGGTKEIECLSVKDAGTSHPGAVARVRSGPRPSSSPWGLKQRTTRDRALEHVSDQCALCPSPCGDCNTVISKEDIDALGGVKIPGGPTFPVTPKTSVRDVGSTGGGMSSGNSSREEVPSLHEEDLIPSGGTSGVQPGVSYAGLENRIVVSAAGEERETLWPCQMKVASVGGVGLFFRLLYLLRSPHQSMANCARATRCCFNLCASRESILLMMTIFWYSRANAASLDSESI